MGVGSHGVTYMAQSQTAQLTVLVLGHPDWGDEFPAWAHEHAIVHHVDALKDATAALSARRFDLILCDADDFTRLQDLHFSKPARTMIEQGSQAVGIVDRAGQFEWASPRMLGFSERLQAQVVQCCLAASARTEAAGNTPAPDLSSQQVQLVADDGRRLELTATPVVDPDRKVTHIAAIVCDSAAPGPQQDKLDAIEEAGRELLSLDAAQFSSLDPQERLALLEQKILRCTRDVLHFDNFEVRILDKKSKKLDLILSAGVPPDAIEAVVYAEARDNGIAGYVAARRRSYICPDVTKDARYLRGIDDARSSLTVPLWLRDKVVGVANFESTRLAAFTEDDRQFAEIFGRYIVLSLHLLELMATERRATTGQLGSNVMAEITAPLNDILTDVETLVEDYIGHDDLRHRLRKISQNAVNIRETIKDLTTSEAGLVGVRTKQSNRRDPTLDGKRVLVADDEQILRETVRDVLTGYGCRVSTASTGGEAIELITSQAFDLVLSDIKMPVHDGYDVFAAAKQANPNTPVILTTGFGYDPNHSIVRAHREGLAAVLFKPFKVDQLLTEIRNALQPTT